MLRISSGSLSGIKTQKRIEKTVDASDMVDASYGN